MISNITVALLGIVDTAVLGHLDNSHYLGAITLALVIFNFLYWGLGFLRMGTTGQTAQAFGSKDNTQIRTVLAQAVLLAVFIISLILILQSALINTSFALLHGSDEVKQYGRVYYHIAICAVPFTLLNLVLSGWLIGMHRAGDTLIIAVFINVINIVLDLLLVWGMGLTVDGVAYATVLAQVSGFILSVILTRQVLIRHPGQWIVDRILDVESIKKMLSINNNIFLRTLSLLLVFAFFTHQGAGMGDDVLAANAILKNFYILLALSLDGFATASEALVGEAIGKKDRSSFWLTVKSAMQWSVIFAVGFTLFYLFFGDNLIAMMTSIRSIQYIAEAHLIWMVIAPLIAVWCYVWDGVFVGATRGKEMRDWMLVSTFLVFLPAWYICEPYGNHGLWLAFTMFQLSRSVTMSFAAYRIEKKGGFVSV